MLTVGEHCCWPSLAGPPLGPSVWLHLGVQVSMRASACFSGGHAGPAAWLIVCLCHGACHQGRLVCSGPSRGLGMGPAGSTPLTIWWPCFSTSAFLHINRNKENGLCQPAPFCSIPSPFLERFVGSFVQGHLPPCSTSWSSYRLFTA